MRLELYGIARLRAGRPALDVDAASVGEALAALGRACPGLDPAHLLLSLNGERFVSDPAIPLAPTDTLVVLNAEAGG